MGRVSRKFLVVSAISLSCFRLGGFGQAVNELDPGVTIAIDLTRKLRLDFASGREKSEELDSAKWKLTAGASFRMKPLFTPFKDHADSDKHHVLVLGAAYEYSIASDAGDRSIEHKLMLDGTTRYAFPKKLLMSDRSRFEFRWVNGNYHFRYRNRLMLERPVKIKTFQPTPYGSAEAFWDQRYKTWSQFKFTGGVQIPFIRRSSFDVYYERQHCVTCSNAHTNIYGVTLNLYLRRKK